MSEAGPIVIIGAGLAGATAAIALRAEGFDGKITLVGEETHPPYERPPLSKGYLQGSSTADDMLVKPGEWYAENDVTLLTGAVAERIDRAAKQVHLGSGPDLPYDRLILATGATSRRLSIPGAELALTLRRLEDSDALKEGFAKASSVVIIGGGWIGLETAAAARQAGLVTTVIERDTLPLQRVLGAEMATYFAELHRRNGVELRLSTSTEAISGAGPYVVTSGDGSLEADMADMVVMGVGAAPSTALAEEAGLAIDNGILVDEGFRTSDPAIFAVGDVANARNGAFDAPLRVEHWDNAIRQGKAVAKTMLGQDISYDWQPYFFTDQFDLGMEYVGHGDAADEVVIRGAKAGGELVAVWLRDGVVTAGMNVNVWDVNDDLRALIGRNVDRDRLANPEVPFTEVAT